MNTLSPEDQEFEALQARRQELEQGMKEARANSPSSLESVLKGLFQGTRSGMAEQGLNTVQGNPELSDFKHLLNTQEDLKPFADQHDGMLADAREYLHQEHQNMEHASPEERMAFKTGNWMGSGLATPVPSSAFKSAQGGGELLKRLVGYLGKDAAIGAGSSVLQEEGMNPFMADMIASLTGRNAHLLSPHSQAERSAGHIVKKAAQDTLKEGEVPLTVETALQAMKKQMGSEQAGEILRKALLEKIQGLDDAAKNAIYKQYPQVKKDIHLRERMEQGNGLEKLWQKGESAADPIREDRTLGKMLEPGQDSRPYALGNAEIPELFLNKSMESVENAKQLVKVVGKDKNAKKALEGYVQHHVLSHVMDEKGKVDVKKLTQWKKMYPSYGILHPKLTQKLNNLFTSQMFANSVMHQAKDLPLMEIASHVPRQTLGGFLSALKGSQGTLPFITTFLTHHYQDLKNRKTAAILKDVMGDQDMLTLLATKPNQLWSKGALLNRISGRDVARSVQDKSSNIQELNRQLGQYFTSSQTQ